MDKVNDQKFSVKAQVFVGVSWCLVKVRIYYRDGEENCAVEFQRRDGDLIAFHDVYSQAAKYLKDHVVVVVVENAHDALQGAISPPSTISSVSSDTIDEKRITRPNLSHQFDLEAAQDSLTPSFQLYMKSPAFHGEVSCNILAAIEHPSQSVIMQLSQCEHVEMLIKLSVSDRFVVAFPAACALARLACLPEAYLAVSHILKQTNLMAIVSTLRAQSTAKRVRLELIRCLQGIQSNHAVSPQQVQDLSEATEGIAMEQFERRKTSIQVMNS
jgi:hypothetical protein